MGIMRLRQVVDHAFLLVPTMVEKEVFNLSTIKSWRESLEDRDRPTPMLDMMERWCLQHRKLGRASSRATSESTTAGRGTEAVSGDQDGIIVPYAELLCPACFNIKEGTGQLAEVRISRLLLL